MNLKDLVAVLQATVIDEFGTKKYLGEARNIFEINAKSFKNEKKEEKEVKRRSYLTFLDYVRGVFFSNEFKEKLESRKMVAEELRWLAEKMENDEI